jgi:ATP-dependent protease ClpP protease subunit
MIKFDYKIIGEITDYQISYIVNLFEENPKQKLFNILLHSGGGNGDAAFAIADYIEQQKNRGKTVNIYCCGRAESAAIIILDSASRRYSLQRCMFMTHSPRIGDGSWSIHRKHVDKLNRTKRLYNAVARTITTKKLQYYTPQQALEAGLIDEIIYN